MFHSNLNVASFLMLNWVIGLRPIVRLWDMYLQGECPRSGAYLRDSIPYLSEFWRNPRKTLNDKVDKGDWGLNLAPSIYQLWAHNSSATGGALLWCFDIWWGGGGKSIIRIICQSLFSVYLSVSQAIIVYLFSLTLQMLERYIKNTYYTKKA